MTFTDAAVLLLKAEGKPLTWRKLAELAVRHDLLTHVGTDPGETMHVRLTESVRRLGDRSPFQEGKGGTFALREWRGGSPGPLAAAVTELATHAAKAAAPAPAAADAGAQRGGRRGGKVEPQAAGGGKRRRGGKRGSATDGAESEEGGGVETMTDETEATPATPEASGQAAGPADAAPPTAAGEPTGAGDAAPRTGEGRKRRRRNRRGKGGGGATVETAPSPAGVPAERAPSPAQQQPPQAVTPSVAAPPSAVAASASGGAPASFDLGRAAEVALRWLRGGSSRRPLRVGELLAQWNGRGMPEGRMPPAALASALAAADAGVRVGSSLVGLSGGRWAPTEWAWGDEVAALERRVGEAVAQHQAALRRTVLRRLSELPLAVFQQLTIALLAAEGFRELRPMDEPAGSPESLLLRGRMPYGPAEIAMVVLVVRAAPGRFIGEDQAAALRGRLPRTGACGGAIYTTGRLSDAARRDLVPPNAIPLLAVEHEALVERLLAHRIGIRSRVVELPALDPDVFAALSEPERG
jgi:hypothetical protein